MSTGQMTTKYTVDVPETLWEEWKETVPRRLNLNEGLVKLLAEDTLEKRGDQLDEDTRAEIERILNEIER